MEIHAHVPEMGKTWMHWLLEGVFIVISVLLASQVGQCREARNNRELAGHALHAIVTELDHNVAVVEPLEAIHSRWIAALNAADTADATQSGFDLFFSLRPPLPTGAVTAFAFLRRSAWDAAQAGGAFRFIDYDVGAKIADIYAAQNREGSDIERLSSALASPLIFDPLQRKQSIRMFWLTLADIQSTEEDFLKQYHDQIPAIRAAAGTYP